MMADDHYLTSFLFPNETVAYTLSTDEINRERQRLENGLRDVNKCPHCSVNFSSKGNMKRHLRQNICRVASESRDKCDKCKKVFSRAFCLKRHEKTCGEKASAHTCEICGKSFVNDRCLKRHIRLRHALCCPICKETMSDKCELKSHARGHLLDNFLTLGQARTLRRIVGKSVIVRPHASSGSAASSAQTGPSTSPQPGPSGSGRANRDHQSSPRLPGAEHVVTSPVFEQTSRQIHGNAGIVYSIVPSGLAKHSMLNLFSEKRENLVWNLKTHLERWNNVKWYLSIRTHMIRLDSEGNIRDEERPTFRSTSQVLIVSDRIEFQIDQAFFKVNCSLETFCSTASGWMLDEILLAEQHIFRYVPLGSNCGDLNLPPYLANTRALINVTGRPAESKQCFIWAVTAALHHAPDVHSGAVHWTCFQEERNLYRMPECMQADETVTLVKIPEFEKLNKVSVNVYAHEDHFFPLYVSTFKGNRGHADLLLIHLLAPEMNRTFQHYCAITDLARLVNRQHVPGHRIFMCPRCLTSKYSAADLHKHLELCSMLDPLRIKMPDPEKKFVTFKNHSKQLEMPFVIVARFECYRRPILDIDEPTEGVTVRERLHEPCAFSYYRLSVDDSHPSTPVFFSDDSPAHLWRCLSARSDGSD